MADAHIEYEHRDGTSLEFPQSQELFSDPEYDTERDSANSTHESSSLYHDDDSLFQANTTRTPTRIKRIRGAVKPNVQPALPFTSSDSSEYESKTKKLTVKEIVEKHFNKKEKKKRKRRKHLYTRRKQVDKKKKKSSLFFKQRKKRLWLHRGIRFPFTSFKYLPFTLYFPYEQFVFGGFLNHIKRLKFEYHLQNSLKSMDSNKELENGDLGLRKYSYIDEDGPISPISESGENYNCDEDKAEDCDVEIVENNSFILESRVPEKKQWKIKRKLKQKKVWNK